MHTLKQIKTQIKKLVLISYGKNKTFKNKFFNFVFFFKSNQPYANVEQNNIKPIRNRVTDDSKFNPYNITTSTNRNSLSYDLLNERPIRATRNQDPVYNNKKKNPYVTRSFY